MIQSLGSDWLGNALAMLQDNMGASMAEVSEAGLSPAEIIVSRSVKELDQNTQKLFMLLGKRKKNQLWKTLTSVFVYFRYRT